LTGLDYLDIIRTKLMRIPLPLILISRIVLFVLLTTLINSMYGTPITECHAAGSNSPVAYSDVSTPHDCPCFPHDEQHTDHDGCTQCVNCACHAPLTMHPFQLVYRPVIAVLQTLVPLTILPEVFLSLFVPPDSAFV
jgi:hypothetical protein